MSRAFDARVLLRYVRLAIYAACLGWIVWGTRGLRLVEVPAGLDALYDFVPGQTVLVADLPESAALSPGDAVIFFRTRDQLAFGRVVALPGDRLENDPATQRTRRVGADEPWYRWSDDVPPQPPTDDRVLVLTENPVHRAAGGAIRRAAIVSRIVVAIPW